jgi:hypothetical protein
LSGTNNLDRGPSVLASSPVPRRAVRPRHTRCDHRAHVFHARGFCCREGSPTAEWNLSTEHHATRMPKALRRSRDAATTAIPLSHGQVGSVQHPTNVHVAEQLGIASPQSALDNVPVRNRFAANEWLCHGGSVARVAPTVTSVHGHHPQRHPSVMLGGPSHAGVTLGARSAP